MNGRKHLYHYVVVRSDLPHGVQLAQTIHAAGESCDGPVPSGTHAVALAVRDESHLREIAGLLWSAQVPHTLIRESSAPYNGAAMAIGIHPLSDRTVLRGITSSLPLAK